MRNLTYDLFVEKFQREKTTDDCYTPEAVYNVVRDWCVKEYNLNPDSFVRPFYPDSDYLKFKYPDNCVVVDNPPFSILAEIVQFYLQFGIKFFLFAHSKTILSLGCYPCCFICTNARIIYENGARINSSFITNLEDAGVRSAPELLENIQKVQGNKKSLPKYQYPDEVLRFNDVEKFSSNGVDFKVDYKDLHFIRALDNQKQDGKRIFGAGFLMSQEATKKRLEAEKKTKEIDKVQEWTLSDREKNIIFTL